MKTKYLLSALALPALLAACVNDDFETQNQGSSMVENDLLKGRAMGELVISADKYGVENEADTRVNGVQEGNGINWYWQPGDQLGAVVVNYGGNNRDEIVGGDADYVITNFPFNANLNAQARRATFSTLTAVVEGAYFFYNQYDREGIERGKIQHTLNQYINVESGIENTGLIQVGTNKSDGKNFFISPITKVKVKDGEGEAMTAPISLQSIYSVLQMKFNLELSNEFAGRDVKIYKVELERSEAGEQGTKKFRNNFTLDPLELAKLQKQVATENTGAAWTSVLVPTNEDQTNAAVIDATNLEANREYVETAMGKVLEKLQDPTTLESCFTEGESKLVYQLEAPYSFKDNNGAQMQLMVLVPSDVYELNDKEENRDDAKKGILKMTVYTSEGIYRSYVITEAALENWGKTHQDEYVKGQYTFKRGGMATTTKTIRIGGDRSNITFYDFQTEGFPVATTADWNYAIDYINEHTSQFGGGEGGSDGNNWNFPKLNLSNYNDQPIKVDAAHYFPNMRVIYNGDAVLKLVGQSEYKLNPRNMIFGTKENRPTILIEDQPNSTVTFDYTSEKPATIEDGKNYTNAWKLDSDAKINVAENQAVTFEMLKSHTNLNIAKGANVEVLDGKEETLTEGTVTLAEGDAQTTTKFTVKNEYTNKAVLSINKYAVATLDKDVTNNGTVDVTGYLDGNAVFTNAEAGILNVKAWEVEMNDKSRGQAVLAAVQNNGTINLEKRKQNYSGTYGGDLMIEQKLDNRGEVMVEGILTVFDETLNQGDGLQNSGLIQLGYDPYAQIRVNKSMDESVNTGEIELLAPEEYEFFDNYYLKEGGQELSKYKGVIKATLDNETYKKVMANYDRYTAQERAWEVINKVIVTDKLELEDNTENADIDFVLNNNASIDIKEEVTIASLTTAGTGTAITTTKAGTVFNANEDVTVAAGNDLTVGEGLKLMFLNNAASFNAPMLDVAGLLTNKGQIDTKNADPANNIYTAIRQGGRINNNGYLSKDGELKYDEASFNALAGLVGQLWNGTDQGNGCVYRGTWGAAPRVDLVMNSTPMKYNDKSTWETNTTNTPDNAVTQERLEYILKNGTWSDEVQYGGQTFKTLVAVHPNNGSYSYLLYLPENNMTEEMTNTWKQILKDAKYRLTEGDLFSNYTVNGTWFNVQNWGILDLSNEASHAWGESEEMIRSAYTIGYFDNDPEHNK